MQQPEWIKDSTGKITGYKTPGGADTVFPFSSFKSGTIEQSIISNNIEIETGFRPKYICCFSPYPSASIYSVDFNAEKVQYLWAGNVGQGGHELNPLPNNRSHTIREINDNGFIFGKSISYTYYWFAFG